MTATPSPETATAARNTSSASIPIDLEAKYEAITGRAFMTGVQALARVAMDQMRIDRTRGLKTSAFISGYPGSPLAGFDKQLLSNGELLKELGVKFEPGLNEELAATAVMGAQMASKALSMKTDGVVGMWYAKAPGLDRASDPIRHANYLGVPRTRGVLACVGDDPASKSSTLPSSSESQLADLALPVLCPGSPQEVLDLGLHGIGLSRASALWCGFKIVTAVADSAGAVDLDLERLSLTMPNLPDGRPSGREAITDIGFAAFLEAEREIYEVRLGWAIEYASLNRLNRIEQGRPSGDRIGFIVPSHLHGPLMHAFDQCGLGEERRRQHGIRVLRLAMLFPLERNLVRRFAEGLEQVVIVEERRPFLETAVRDTLYGVTGAPAVLGKTGSDDEPLVPAYGALEAGALERVLRRHLGHLEGVRPERDRIPVSSSRPWAFRTPYFCPGCPHNTSSRVPDGAVVGTGIGCHGMIGFMDPERVGAIATFTPMGGEGAQWIGAAPFVEEDHFFQNVGDGTFFHSGQLAIQAAIAAGVNVTFKILDNRAVAMTGGQHPTGQLEPAVIARMLMTLGVQRVIITTEDRSRYRRVELPAGVVVWDRSRLVEAQEELASINGVTALIHDQQCAAEARRLRKRGRQAEPAQQVVIAERVCEGCGDCGYKSNCLAVPTVATEFGTKRTIDQTSCNRDYSCLDGDCPSFVTLQPRTRRPWPRRTRMGVGTLAAGTLTAEELPMPDASVPTDEFAIRMPGVGGTGVVTVSQILGVAAQRSGRFVQSLDQTGLAQKGGPVISDLRVSAAERPESPRIESGSVDLNLVFDLVVGVSDANISGNSADRTVLVASTTMIPRGIDVSRRGARIRDASPLTDRIAGTCRPEPTMLVDTHAVTRDLFGNTATANVLLLGTAFQLGAVPLPASDIELAIEANGVAVNANLQAFRWGRMLVVDPSRVDRAHTRSTASTPSPAELLQGFDGELGRLLEVRVPDLIEYQNRRLAHRYVEVVRKVAAAEQRVDPTSHVLAERVARYLHKLMAYKDEYEVARLLLHDATVEPASTPPPGNGRPQEDPARSVVPPGLRRAPSDEALARNPYGRLRLYAHPQVRARSHRGVHRTGRRRDRHAHSGATCTSGRATFLRRCGQRLRGHQDGEHHRLPRHSGRSASETG